MIHTRSLPAENMQLYYRQSVHVHVNYCHVHTDSYGLIHHVPSGIRMHNYGYAGHLSPVKATLISISSLQDNMYTCMGGMYNNM